MLELLGKERMQEIMKKAFSLFYPAQMQSLYGLVDPLEGCSYFAFQSDIHEHLVSEHVEFFRYSEDYFVLSVGFFRLSGHSSDFDVCFRIRFRLCDLEVA